MVFTTGELRAAIRLVSCDHDPLCHGFRWEIDNQSALAEMVAWTLQGHSRHAERVLTTLASTALQTWPTAAQQAIDSLTLDDDAETDVPRWHRDGLVFQHIAWLVSVIERGNNVAASLPHLLPAHKGFDALLVPLNNKNAATEGIVICEEKATTHPRQQIVKDVWPSIISIDAGERDAELTGELTALLQRYNVTNIEQILAEAHWLNRKAYRVSITIGPNHDKIPARKRLFAGYDEVATGDVLRRRAETVAIPNLRNWMDDFCLEVIAAIRRAA